MTVPANRVSGRMSALPAPELVCLPDDPIGAEDVVPALWWVEYGGTLDPDGLVSFPRLDVHLCPITECPTCKGA